MLRARRITTHLIEVITRLGWQFVEKKPEPAQQPYYRRRYEGPEEVERSSAHFLVEDERLYISITERQIRKERPLTAQEERQRRQNPTGYFYYADRYSYHPSGELTLHVSSSPGRGSGFASFRDSKRKRLEVKISDLLRCLLQEALDIKKRRKEAAEAAERQRQEEERREHIRNMREAHAHLISRLEAEAGAWARARRLRRYLRAARRALGSEARVQAMLEGEAIDLLAIGEEFANQLDPALRAVRLFDGADPYATGLRYESDETKLRKFIARTLGGDWRNAPKMKAASDSSPPECPKSDREIG